MMYRFDNAYRFWRFVLVGILFFSASLTSFSQTDSVWRISLILAFQTNSSGEKLNDYLSAHDVFTANRMKLDEDAIISLDFYEGLMQSLKEYNGKPKIELSVYDGANSDSIVQLILQQPEMKKQDVIMGSVSTSTARLVASFCKDHKILNIQPFTPSKSLTTDNPYHLKLAPTIDAHVDAMYNSILDSFAGANIILYTPDSENSIGIASRFDSLFNQYNKTASKKFTVTLLNTGNMMLNGKKTTAAEQLVPDRLNILILTSFEESFVNGNLRMLYEQRTDNPMIVYGMPTWMSGDILRLDYLNDYSARITDIFYLDTTKLAARQFIENYRADYTHEPSRYAYLGYDVMNFAIDALNTYGRTFPEMIYTQRYSGAGYKMDVVKHKAADNSIQYYENRYVNVFKVDNYRMQRVW